MAAERIFISYRSVDGADKATALARELSAMFGSEQVFIDKEDLPGGSRWRDVIASKIGEQPVLLMLVTPQFFDARDAQGRRRIEQPDDPVRAEVAAALAANARIIPMLCDGVDCAPDGHTLPPPLDFIGELTWRRLRDYDWTQDMARLVGDLRAAGLQPLTAAGPTAALPLPAGVSTADPARARRRALWWLGGGVTVTAMAAGAGFLFWRHTGPTGPTRLSGPWLAIIGARGASTVQGGTRLGFKLSQEGAKVGMVSLPLPIDKDPAWTNYRDFWKQSTGAELQRVVYRLQGEVRDDGTGAPVVIDAAMRIETELGDGPIDGGGFRGVLGEGGEGGRHISGRLWVNSEQADRMMELRPVAVMP